MRYLRYNDHSPRVEMLPLIDVIFLLLTFFIYSLMVMVRADVMPVALTPLQVGQQAQQAVIQAITVDRDGQLYFNREPVDLEQLDHHLQTLAQDPDAPTLYLAVESVGSVDRGPLVLDLLQRVRHAGVRNFAIVGPPDQPHSDR